MTATAIPKITPCDDDVNGNVPAYHGWCPLCYSTAIERFCDGFIITHTRVKLPDRKVDPLPAWKAKIVRDTRDLVIYQRTGWPSDAARHAQHPGA